MVQQESILRIADNSGARDRELFERGQRSFRLIFLEHSQQRVQQDDREDRCRIDPFPEQAGQDGGPDEDPNDDVGELRPH